MSEPVEVTLYTRADCMLCDKAKAAIRAAESLYRLNIELREVDVDTDDDLRQRFTNDLPVIYIAGSEAFRHRVDPRELAGVIRGGARPRSSLASEKCVPCRGGVPPLRGKELLALERELGEGWRVVGEHHLEREFPFPDFAEALAFTNRVGAIAEEEGHHPDIHLAWGQVRIEIWTHKINGLTRSDFILAAKIDGVMV
jgi:4a-hydroxytetrahydrobiopterin dehydratase